MHFSSDKYSLFSLVNTVFLTIILLLPSCGEKKEPKTVIIGKQEWMTADARVMTYRNGDSIVYCKNIDEWYEASKRKIGACCHVRFDSIKGAKYGLLYNFYAAADKRGLAPKGYKLPSAADWQELIAYAGGTDVAGKKLKANDGSWYPSDEFICEDKYGFKAKYTLTPEDTAAINAGKFGQWWTSDTADEPYYAQYAVMSYATNTCLIGKEAVKESGMSVRFLKE